MDQVHLADDRRLQRTSGPQTIREGQEMVRLSYAQKMRLDYSGGQLREIRFEYGSVTLTIGTVEVDVSAEELDGMLADLELEDGFTYLSWLFEEQGYCPEVLGYLEAVAKRIVEQARISLAFGRRAA